MSTRRVIRSLVVLAASLGGLAAAPPAQAQQSGSITGRVTDAASGQPVVGAQVGVVGTTLGGQTNGSGQYTIRGVRPGPAEVRALRVGYSEQKQTVTVAAGQAATADFRMTAVPVTLTPVVTTATGEQRRVEVGNAIAQVDAAKVVEQTAVSNMGDLLTARAAGVTVFGGTQTGAGTRVRIRGTSSISLSNNPIYVIDGTRVEGTTGASSVSVGGTTASRVGDLNPEEIESIEIVRGPSAATLYGTDAANGVIVITTKKGVAGRPQWTYYTEQTAIRDENDYPTAYTGWRTGTTAATTTTPSNAISAQCFLTQVAAGTCTQDSVTSYNLTKDAYATPFGTGYRQQHGLQLRGGNETLRFFLHGEWEDEDGATRVPKFEEDYLARHELSLRPEQRSPNALNKVTARGNFTLSLPSNLEIGVSAGYITQDLRFVRSDDSGTPGVAANIYGGPGIRYNLNAQSDTLYGWREFTPRNIYQIVTNQAIERVISSVSPNWRPNDWLAFRGNFGLDYIDRGETQLCRLGECASTSDRLGFKIDNRSNYFIYTADASGTATRPITETIESQTTAGVQYYRNVFTRNGAVGEQLPPGAVTVTAGAVQEADETTSESRTLGAFLEQRVSFNDRLFVTGALRSDRNSAFGADFKTVFYPKLAVSWVVSQEPFFPALGWLDQLRLRSAYGASGVQPGTTDAVQFFAPTATLGESGEQPGLVFSALGNANLKPERSAELEVGVDGTFWNSRVTSELTYYNKRSTDALVSRILPPSLGTGLTSRFENLGEVRNWGWEALLNAQLVQRDAFGWDVTLNGSKSDNKLVSLGGVPNIGSGSTQQREGYPLNGWWSRRLVSFADANNDGIIVRSEMVVTDTTEYHGFPQPNLEAALTNGFDLFQRRVRLSAMLDYKGGHKVYNNTERIRCASRNNCAALISKENSTLFEQARTVMIRELGAPGGFFEDGDFLRLRELSLTATAPDEWASRFLRGRSMTATLAVRNVGILWTKYTGVDPEAFGTTGDAPSSFQAFAPPTYYTLRFNLGF
jgi:TonB-linked SusC/RagA family outer membrane protein